MANKLPYDSLNHRIFERILLEKFKVMHIEPVNVSLLTEDSIMQLAQRCKYKITKEFWSQREQITHTFEIQVPSSWWQHFKQDKIHWKWFLKKFPVKTITLGKTITVDAYRVFMDMPCPMDENGAAYQHKFFIRALKEEDLNNN
jgi:hypothetical protein